MKRSFQPGLWSTLGVLVSLAILLALGTWQLLRFQEKSASESLRDARLEAAPVALTVGEATAAENDYRIVRLDGHFVPDHLFLFKFRVRDGVPGYWLAQLFEGNDGEEILVNRGWIPFDGGLELAEELRSDARTELTGLVFTPAEIVPDEATRAELADAELPPVTTWNSYDISAIYTAAGVEQPRPTIIVASPEMSGDPHPIASYDYVVAPYLTSEKHLGYCVTWYTLSVALILMWIAYGFGYLGSYASRAGGQSPTNAPKEPNAPQ